MNIFRWGNKDTQPSKGDADASETPTPGYKDSRGDHAQDTEGIDPGLAGAEALARFQNTPRTEFVGAPTLDNVQVVDGPVVEGSSQWSEAQSGPDGNNPHAGPGEPGPSSSDFGVTSTPLPSTEVPPVTTMPTPATVPPTTTTPLVGEPTLDSNISVDAEIPQGPPQWAEDSQGLSGPDVPPTAPA